MPAGCLCGWGKAVFQFFECRPRRRLGGRGRTARMATPGTRRTYDPEEGPEKKSRHRLFSFFLSNPCSYGRYGLCIVAITITATVKGNALRASENTKRLATPHWFRQDWIRTSKSDSARRAFFSWEGWGRRLGAGRIGYSADGSRNPDRRLALLRRGRRMGLRLLRQLLDGLLLDLPSLFSPFPELRRVARLLEEFIGRLDGLPVRLRL
jgi:hypothetical protein